MSEVGGGGEHDGTVEHDVRGQRAEMWRDCSSPTAKRHLKPCRAASCVWSSEAHTTPPRSSVPAVGIRLFLLYG